MVLGSGQGQPLAHLREKHLVRDAKRVVAPWTCPWTWTLLGERRGGRLADHIADEGVLRRGVAAATPRIEHIRKDASPPGRGHAPGQPSGANRQPSGDAPPQEEVERFTPLAPQVRPVPSQTETPSGIPLPPQPEQGAMTSPAATNLGSLPTDTLHLRRSREPVGEPSLSPAEATSTPPEVWSPISSAQPGTSSRIRSPTSAQLRAEAGLEALRVRTPSAPTLMVPVPIHLCGLSPSATTGTCSPTRTPVGFQPTHG